MSGLRKAVVLATTEQQFQLGTNFVIAIVTSRLMDPHEIGIAVLGTAIVGLVTALREFAAPTYLISNRDLSPDETHSALTGIILWNALITLGLGLVSPLFGWMYGDARVATFLQIVAVALMVEAFSLPLIAVLRREMAFDKSAAIVASGTAVTLVGTLALAAAGYGYLSFALGMLMGYVVSVLVGLAIRPRFWLFRPRLTSLRGLFVFGGFNGSNAMLRQLYDSLPYMVLGRVLSFESVAFFHRALMLSQLPQKLLLTGVENLLLPALTRQTGAAGGLKIAFLRTVECVTAVYWPTLIVAAILAQPLVSMLYGPAFAPAAPIFQIMALAALFVFMGKLDVPILIAAGGMKDMLRRGLVVFPLSAAITTASAMLGIVTLAASYWATYPLQLFSSLYVIRRHIAFTWGEFGAAMSKSSVAALASAVGPVLFALVFEHHGWTHAALFSAGAAAIGGWLVALWVTRHALLMEALRRESMAVAQEDAPAS